MLYRDKMEFLESCFFVIFFDFVVCLVKRFRFLEVIVDRVVVVGIEDVF